MNPPEDPPITPDRVDELLEAQSESWQLLTRAKKRRIEAEYDEQQANARYLRDYQRYRSCAAALEPHHPDCIPLVALPSTDAPA